MRRILIALTLAVSFAASFAAHAEDAARAQVEKMMNAFAAMDLDTFKTSLTADVVGYDFDLEGKPVRLGSRDEAIRFAEATFAEVKKMGGKLKIDIHKFDCDSGSTLAYCTIEFDFIAAMPDGHTMSMPTRNTMIVRKGSDGWKLSHWHSSLAVAGK